MRMIVVSALAFAAACTSDRAEMHVLDPTGSTLNVWQAREMERTAGTLAFECPAFVPDGAAAIDLRPTVVVARQTLPTQISPDFEHTLVARYCQPTAVRGPARGVAYVPAVVHVVLPNEPVDYQDLAFSALDGTGFLAPDSPRSTVLRGDRPGVKR